MERYVQDIYSICWCFGEISDLGKNEKLIRSLIQFRELYWVALNLMIPPSTRQMRSQMIK